MRHIYFRGCIFCYFCLLPAIWPDRLEIQQNLPELMHNANLDLRNTDLDEYDYDLPEELIAQYPLEKRDASRLLVLRNGEISAHSFSGISEHIPEGSLLLFNNSRVIHARLLFRKDSGALIEILCIEPSEPPIHEAAFMSQGPLEWKCIVGNLKKWKSGTLGLDISLRGSRGMLLADLLENNGDTCVVRFSWTVAGATFAEVIDCSGHMPLPPYIERPDEEIDRERYQTVYSSTAGSVAAPTAGLHFTQELLEKIRRQNIEYCNVTLHVGAGTFQPVKVSNITDHEMHREHFLVNADTVRRLAAKAGSIIPVGTTSLRTLESLYWIGVKIIHDRVPPESQPFLGQWEAYELPCTVEAADALNALAGWLENKGEDTLRASTSLLIVPGYRFRLTDGLVTNFHQPRSTLLLLVSAWAGEKWTGVYRYAVENRFRFLSYGDSSLLLR